MLKVIEQIFVALVIASFVGIGAWALLFPIHYFDTLGADFSPLTVFSESEIRIVGALYLLAGLAAVVGVFNAAFRQNAYLIFLFMVSTLLLARLVEFGHLKVDRQLLIITAMELLFWIYAFAKWRKA